MSFDDHAPTMEDIQALRRVLPELKERLRQLFCEVTDGNCDLTKVDALLDEEFGFIQLQLARGIELGELIRELFPESPGNDAQGVRHEDFE